MRVVGVDPVTTERTTYWEFFVGGHPVTQGSLKAYVVKGRARITHSDVALRPWREALGYYALAARGAAGPIAGPVVVELLFELAKPASAPKRKRTWPIRKRSGDLDKLARAALDALAGVLFIDDAQVVRLVVEKDWANASGPGVQVCVYERTT